MNRFLKIGLVFVAVIAIAGTAVGFVAAQTDGEGASGDRPNFAARLAENLGITQGEFEAAVRTTQLQLLDEAVADGRIGEERAAEIRTRIESGEAPLFPGGRHQPKPCRAVYVVRQVAEFLGVTPEEVAGALEAGQNLVQVAEANGSTGEALSAFLMSKVEAHVARALEAGKIDQARADEILANAGERIDRLIHHEGPLPCRRDQRPASAGEFGGPQRGFPEGFRESGLPQPVPEGIGPVF